MSSAEMPVHGYSLPEEVPYPDPPLADESLQMGMCIITPPDGHASYELPAPLGDDAPTVPFVAPLSGMERQLYGKNTLNPLSKKGNTQTLPDLGWHGQVKDERYRVIFTQPGDPDIHLPIFEKLMQDLAGPQPDQNENNTEPTLPPPETDTVETSGRHVLKGPAVPLPRVEDTAPPSNVEGVKRGTLYTASRPLGAVGLRGF